MVKIFVERLMNSLLLDEPNDGGGGGKPQDGNADADNNGDHKSAGDGQKKPEGGVKPGQEPDKFLEDPRYKGVISDLQKERQARQRYDADLRAAKAELEQERRRIQALVGVNSKSEDEATEELVKQRLQKLYPWMEGMTADDIKDLRELRSQMAEMKNATLHTWQVHGQKMLDSVTGNVEKALGGKLSERQALRIQQAYIEEAKNDPAFLARHEAGDPKLAEEFAKTFIEDFVEPGRRQATAAEVARRPRVPGGRDRSIVGSNDKPIDVKDDKAVEDLLVKGFRERGGQFGARR